MIKKVMCLSIIFLTSSNVFAYLSSNTQKGSLSIKSEINRNSACFYLISENFGENSTVSNINTHTIDFKEMNQLEEKILRNRRITAILVSSAMVISTVFIRSSIRTTSRLVPWHGSTDSVVEALRKSSTYIERGYGFLFGGIASGTLINAFNTNRWELYTALFSELGIHINKSDFDSILEELSSFKTSKDANLCPSVAF